MPSVCIILFYSLHLSMFGERQFDKGCVTINLCHHQHIGGPILRLVMTAYVAVVDVPIS